MIFQIDLINNSIEEYEIFFKSFVDVLKEDLSTFDEKKIDNFFLKFFKNLGKMSLEENLKNNLSEYSVSEEKDRDACLVFGEKYFFDKKEEKWIFEMLFCLDKEFNEFVKLDKVAQKKCILQTFFDDLEVGLLIFDKEKNLTYHNLFFREMNILASTAFEHENEELVGVGDVFYKVKKRVLDNNEFILMSYEKVEVNQNHEVGDDLGIITSSLAHELNNPLAGIITGIEVLLQLNSELDDFSLETLREMKTSADKVKELIQTFLNFYRNDLRLTPMGQVIEQSKSLMSTRLIELNLSLEIELDFQNKDFAVNGPIWTMIHFLILSNFVNQILRDKLIRRVQYKNLKLKYRLSPEEVFFDFPSVQICKNLYTQLKMSQFFKFLLKQIGGTIFLNQKSLKVEMRKVEMMS